MAPVAELATIPNVTCSGETPGGALVIHAGGEKVFIPKAAVHENSEVYAPGHEGDLVIPYYLAEEKGLDGLIED